jgi:cation diffusion facilitator family transporter
MSHPHHPHSHTHGTVDPTMVTTQRGLWAIKWSFIGLSATACIQVVIVWMSGSVALLADTIHNVGDAATAMPLWIAFVLARRPPSLRFTYGLGRAEDLAGVIIVGIILCSAMVAGYQSLSRLLSPQPIAHLGAVGGAALLGFLGNEVVARLRINVGKAIGSAALIAEGYHARVDSWTSVAVLVGVVGAWLGYPIVDPLVGFVITIVIVRIVWESGTTMFTRLLDGVDPTVLADITHAMRHIPEVHDVTQIRSRWIGHRLHAEINLAVHPQLSVAQGQPSPPQSGINCCIMCRISLTSLSMWIHSMRQARSTIAWRNMSTATYRPMRISNEAVAGAHLGRSDPQTATRS